MKFAFWRKEEGGDRFERPEVAAKQTVEQGSVGRRATLALSVFLLANAACDRVNELLGRDQNVRPEAPISAVTRVDSSAAAPVADPNRPDFLDQDSVKARGLLMMMRNNDIFDRYIFNSVTGNRTYAQTSYIQKGYEFDKFEMPYHAFVFKPFDGHSNLDLPKRLGKAEQDTGLARFFRENTVYKADNEKDLQALKTILVTSYEMSFGVKLDPAKIVIEAGREGVIKAIKYVGQQIEVSTKIVTKTSPDPLNRENPHVIQSEDRSWNLTGKNGELLLPPSIMVDQGIALPISAFPEYKEVKYKKTFKSQGKNIHLDFDIPIDSVLEDRSKLAEQGRVKAFNVGGRMVDNFGYYVLDNDPFILALAEKITGAFRTKRQKVQALLDFVYAYDYVPDAYGQASRAPKISLISRGGDCEDSTILLVSLARAVGIECVFAYFDRHAAPLCDVDGPGSALQLDGKNYEWCETTGFVTLSTAYVDSDTGKVVRTDVTKRGFQVGEVPDGMGEIKFITRVEDRGVTFMTK